MGSFAPSTRWRGGQSKILYPLYGASSIQYLGHDKYEKPSSSETRNTSRSFFQCSLANGSGSIERGLLSRRNAKWNDWRGRGSNLSETSTPGRPWWYFDLDGYGKQPCVPSRQVLIFSRMVPTLKDFKPAIRSLRYDRPLRGIEEAFDFSAIAKGYCTEENPISPIKCSSFTWYLDLAKQIFFSGDLCPLCRRL